MTFALMVLICTGHGELADCRYVSYHGEQFESMRKCIIAMDETQNGFSSTVAPEMICSQKE